MRLATLAALAALLVVVASGLLLASQRVAVSDRPSSAPALRLRDWTAGGGESESETSAMVDPWRGSLAALQRLSPPRVHLQRRGEALATHAVVFTHIPKCGGSSFRNSMLFEYVRWNRSPRRFACVFYRDVHFVEPNKRNDSPIVTHGPDSLTPSGRIAPHCLVVTGHIGYGPALLSRLSVALSGCGGAIAVSERRLFQTAWQVPHTSVTFVRDPIARLVSLFNMYPDSTWGRLGSNGSTARFAEVYRRRFGSRNALTCFLSGVTPCDSIGAIDPASIDAAAMELARTNLLHRYAVFGVTERMSESLALVAHTLGWAEHFLQMDVPRVRPGKQHRRLRLSALCAAPRLLAEMQRREAPDRELFAFAVRIYEQRARALPPALRRKVLVTEGAAPIPWRCPM